LKQRTTKNKLIFLLFFPICAIAQQFTAIEKVNVVDVVNGKIVPAQTVLIKDSVIYLIGENIKIPAGARIINAKDQYLIPGLIDTYIHLPWDLDSIMEISTWDQLKYLYLVNGITSVRDASMRGLHKESIAAAKTITAVIP
jgi:imidazolonepropionase-like amidohydrolase